MEAQLKPFIAERGLIKASLTRLKRFCKESVSSSSVASSRKRLESGTELLKEFNAVQRKIELIVINTELEAAHEAEREAFENTYFDVIGELEEYIKRVETSRDEPSRSPVSPAPSSMIDNAQVSIRLPVINLPNFDGKFSEWLEFRDTFDSLVHQNRALSDVQKYHYLKSAIKGSAARAIKALNISEGNYNLAWETLKNRYQNPLALRKHHMDTFLDLPSIQRRSKTELQNFIDDASNHLSALKTLGEPVETWDFIIVSLLVRKLDVVTSREWRDRVAVSIERLTFKHFLEFIEERSKTLEVSEMQGTIEGNDRRLKSGIRGMDRPTAHVVSTSVQCPVCYNNHPLYACKTFKELDHKQKRQIIQKTGRCYNCLSSGHRVQNCTRKRCSICDKLHHTLLHFAGPSAEASSAKGVEAQDTSNALTVSGCMPLSATNVANRSSEYTVLSTAVVYVEDNQGIKRECRVLLDSGSQVHLISREYCQKIGVRETPIEARVSGLGKAINSIKGRVGLRIFSRVNNFQAKIECLSIEAITSDQPNIPLDQSRIPMPPNGTLADPAFSDCRKIDLLIGAGLFWRLLCIGQQQAGRELVWQKTQLGWVLGGRLTWPQGYQEGVSNCCVVTNSQLHNQLERFWKIEEVDDIQNVGSDACEHYFQTTTTRNTEGRYIVRIPFKENITQLGHSRDQAERRLRSLERKLGKQADLRAQYIEFMSEYELLGHMSQTSEIVNDSHTGFYLPHHAVFKVQSTTTKLRVVFDGSAKSSSGLSLNDCQLVGSPVQNDLLSILLRFRIHRYVISADIAKMYRQVLVHPEDRKFQRLLWRSDPQQPIRVFELNTVTYGTASAPFLATRVLKQIGLDCREVHQRVSQIIINDFYVDDLLTGASSIAEAREIKQVLTTILEQAGFSLRKWASNCSVILSENDAPDSGKQISADKDPKTLGLLWTAEDDTLHFSISLMAHPRITKRAILSELAQIFDPLGLIGPITCKGKLIMQELWQLGVGWDESISQDLHGRWIQFRSMIRELEGLRISRCILPTSHLESVEIHGFSDASEKAYGACIYVRQATESGTWRTHLLCSKSRVAPLKVVSLPRLELCGAMLLAQLMSKVKDSLQFSFKNEYYWSDSTITIAWISGVATRWRTFVANRVAEIQRLTAGNQWRHVSSHDNPADLISRGATPSALINNNLWWCGPEWLAGDETQWPSVKEKIIDVPEERTLKTVMAISKNRDFDIFNQFSNYTRLVRVIAYCLKFINKGRKGLDSCNGGSSLSVAELQRSEELLLHLAQREIFSDELTTLKTKGMVNGSSSLASLHPFLDDKGLIRVGGRLSRASIPYARKHPIVLPSKHPLTDLVINYEHVRLLHAGPTLVLASLHKRFWPISGRCNVRRVLHRCVKCFRASPRSIGYQMGQLPAARVTPARPFSTCGIDYAGPFSIKEGVRGRLTKKAYLCLFVCFVTKAVHLELATDLSTEAFLNCLRRFIARRGRCRCIVTDNGTNFIGARNQFSELGILINKRDHNLKISDFLSKEGIEWRLNPPHAPHFGGLWESAVKSTKRHLSRVIGEQRLTFEELYTLLVQVEACLNSRPLTPISSDPSDLNPLTPGHFLIGDSLSALPEHDLRDIKTNRLGRYQLVQQMLQHFWQRWYKEYLHQMQQRVKWQTTTSSSVNIGMLVVIKDDNLPPLRWKLGRILELHPGADGTTRVVSVKTADGVLKRSVNKLCVLPIEAENEVPNETKDREG